MPTLQTTGHTLEVARHRAGLTTAQVAAMLGVHQETIRRWEYGYHAPRHSTLQRLARLYSVHAETLTEGIR